MGVRAEGRPVRHFLRHTGDSAMQIRETSPGTRNSTAGPQDTEREADRRLPRQDREQRQILARNRLMGTS